VGLLEKSTITPTSFTDQYNKTDMFVVEISSRIAYRYQGFFAHHIITESPYGFHDRQNIQQYDLTDQEIENDIVYLKDLLNPKPLLIVSHIYTRKAGKRYELVQVLKDICTRHSIPFFDPSDYLGDTVGVYVNEPVLAHFTQKGHDLVGKKYVELISLLAN
jgi:hypothetical protein